MTHPIKSQKSPPFLPRFSFLYIPLQDTRFHQNSLEYISTACLSILRSSNQGEKGNYFTERTSDMKASLLQELLIGIPTTSSTAYQQAGKSSNRYLPDSAGNYNRSTTKSKQSKVNSVLNRMNKIGRKADNFAHGVREHVRLGPKITDTVKGKLSLGARILLVGGVEKVFMQLFSVREGEKLIKALQCFLSTTSGPIAGLLFISTDKVAFCSDRSIKATSPKGEFIRVRYKVMIPLDKIKCVNQSENVKKPSQKFIEIVTADNFDFWFMGFLNYKKAFTHLQQAIFQA